MPNDVRFLGALLLTAAVLAVASTTGTLPPRRLTRSATSAISRRTASFSAPMTTSGGRSRRFVPMRTRASPRAGDGPTSPGTATCSFRLTDA